MGDQKHFSGMARYSPTINDSPPPGSPRSPPASPPVNIPEPLQTSDCHTQEDNSFSSYYFVPSFTSPLASEFYKDDHDRNQQGNGGADATCVPEDLEESEMTANGAGRITGHESVLGERHVSAEREEASSEEPEKGEDNDKKNGDSGVLSADGGGADVRSRAEENAENQNLEQTVDCIHHTVEELSASGVPESLHTSDLHTQEENSYCIIPSFTSHSANEFYRDDHDRLQHAGGADVTSVSVDERHESAGIKEASSEEPEKGEDDDKKNRDSGALGSIGAGSHVAENADNQNLEQTEGGIHRAVQVSSAGNVPGRSCAVVGTRRYPSDRDSYTHTLLCYIDITKLLKNEIYIAVKKETVLENLLEVQVIVLPNTDHSNGIRCHDICLEATLKGHLLTNVRQETVTCEISTVTKVKLGEEWTDATVPERRRFRSDGCLNYCCPLVESSEVIAHCHASPWLESSIEFTLYPKNCEARVHLNDEQDMVIVESLHK